MKAKVSPPRSKRMRQWIEDLVSLGIRRPGSPGDRLAEDFLEAQLRGFGYDVQREPVPLTHWEVENASLRVDGQTIPCFPIPFTASTSTTDSVPLAFMGKGSADDFAREEVRGKVAVVEIEFASLDLAPLKAAASFIHDPNGDVPDGPLHVANWMITNIPSYYRALRDGACAFLGLLVDSPEDGPDLFVPYDGFLKELPGAWIGREHADRVRRGQEANFTVRARHETVETHNIVATLGGTCEETVVVTSHHDAPFASAVEDASGLSVLLALAESLQSRPVPPRRQVRFLAASGHFHGGIGNREYVRRHRDGDLRNIVAALGVEHIAQEAQYRNGRYEPTGRPEVRAAFTAENARLQSIVSKALVDAELDRTLVLPPYLYGPEPPCDAAPFFTSGVASMCLISGPPYIFGPHDSPEMVRDEDLERVCDFMLQVLDEIDVLDRSELQGGAAPLSSDEPSPPPWFLSPAVHLALVRNETGTSMP